MEDMDRRRGMLGHGGSIFESTRVLDGSRPATSETEEREERAPNVEDGIVDNTDAVSMEVRPSVIPRPL